MDHNWPVPIEGGCVCGALRFRLNRDPMIVHCCNCTQCQRDTGSAFAVNLVVEADQVILLPGAKANPAGPNPAIVEPKLVLMPSRHPGGLLVARCPQCFVAVWSLYAGAGPFVKFLRGGTLDKRSVDGRSVADALHPDMYIYTSSKMPWMDFPEAAKSLGNVFGESYDESQKWPKDSLDRFMSVMPKTQQWIDRGSKWEELGDIADCR